VAAYTNNNLQTKGLSPAKCYDVKGTEIPCANVPLPQVPDGYKSDTCVHRQATDFILFEEGDIYVVGIVPVHNVGSSPLQCGGIKKGGFDIVEAIKYAVHAEQSKFNGRLGVIIVDSCNDPQIIQEKIISIQRLGVFWKGSYVPVNGKIIGYVGGWSSDESAAVARITGRLHQVQISYASTASALSRTVEFPYFLRIPSPDDDQARTIMEIVKRIHTNRTQIQIMYSESSYGEGGRNLIRTLVESERDICIINEIAVSVAVSHQSVIDSLRKYPDAKIVIAFLGSFDVDYIIEGLATIERNEFLFIASEGWGLRQRMSEYPNLTGSISVTARLWVTDSFEKYIAALSPETDLNNPWIRDYMEKQFKCYYQWSFDKSSNKSCT